MIYHCGTLYFIEKNKSVGSETEWVRECVSECVSGCVSDYQTAEWLLDTVCVRRAGQRLCNRATAKTQHQSSGQNCQNKKLQLLPRIRLAINFQWCKWVWLRCFQLTGGVGRAASPPHLMNIYSMVCMIDCSLISFKYSVNKLWFQ